MRGDWKDQAMEYRDVDMAAQRAAEAALAAAKAPATFTAPTDCIKRLDAVRWVSEGETRPAGRCEVAEFFGAIRAVQGVGLVPVVAYRGGGIELYATEPPPALETRLRDAIVTAAENWAAGFEGGDKALRAAVCEYLSEKYG